MSTPAAVRQWCYLVRLCYLFFYQARLGGSALITHGPHILVMMSHVYSQTARGTGCGARMVACRLTPAIRLAATSMACTAAAAMHAPTCCATQAHPFSTFAVNPETSSAPHGPPRGLINRYISMGLPPWAAWCNSVNRHALYRMSNVSPTGFLPKPPQEMDVIWLNERVRERVRTSRQVQNVYRQLKYPYVKTGIHFSDILDHWVQVPMVEAGMFAVERDGGFDNFILKRTGPELRSTYGERIRRHLLVRQKEIQKNFVLEQQARTLAQVIEGEVHGAASETDVDAVLHKYGIDAGNFKTMIAQYMLNQKQSMPTQKSTPSSVSALAQ